MIRAHSALMRMAREFFARELAGLYSFDVNVKLRDPEMVPDKERREERQGKYRECVWLSFSPWEIGIFSSQEKPPLGQLVLRRAGIDGETVVNGPLDPLVWDNVAAVIRSELTHQRKIENEHRRAGW
jgi:hypothetical protein